MNWNNTRRSQQDDRAVSPVIGVILMVAVTVILAAVVSTLVLGMSNEVEATPQASFAFDYDGSGSLEISHNGGASLQADAVTISVSGTSTDWPADADGKVSAGESTSISVSGGEAVRIIWHGSQDTTAILASFQVPA